MKATDRTTDGEHLAPPELDSSILGAATQSVQLLTLELVHHRFVRADDGTFPSTSITQESPEVAIDVDWEFSETDATLGCLIRLATMFPSEREDDGDERSGHDNSQSDRSEASRRFDVQPDKSPGSQPYHVQSEYRVLYRVLDQGLTTESFDQIAYWDATVVVWPYFRADLSSALARANLSPIILPTLKPSA